MEAGKACNFCQRITKYTCLRCQKIACAICAPETPDTGKKSNYNPQHQVGICKDCQTKTKDLGDKVLDKEESPISPTANKRKQWLVSKSSSLSPYTRSIKVNPERQKNCK